MSKPDKQAPAPSSAKAVIAAVKRRETFIRLRRNDYLTSSVEEVTLEDGQEVSRKVLHPPDIAAVALHKAYDALERMVEDR